MAGGHPANPKNYLPSRAEPEQRSRRKTLEKKGGVGLKEPVLLALTGVTLLWNIDQQVRKHEEKKDRRAKEERERREREDERRRQQPRRRREDHDDDRHHHHHRHSGSGSYDHHHRHRDHRDDRNVRSSSRPRSRGRSSGMEASSTMAGPPSTTRQASKERVSRRPRDISPADYYYSYGDEDLKPSSVRGRSARYDEDDDRLYRDQQDAAPSAARERSRSVSWRVPRDPAA